MRSNAMLSCISLHSQLRCGFCRDASTRLVHVEWLTWAPCCHALQQGPYGSLIIKRSVRYLRVWDDMSVGNQMVVGRPGPTRSLNSS